MSDKNYQHSKTAQQK